MATDGQRSMASKQETNTTTDSICKEDIYQNSVKINRLRQSLCWRAGSSDDMEEREKEDGQHPAHNSVFAGRIIGAFGFFAMMLLPFPRLIQMHPPSLETQLEI